MYSVLNILHITCCVVLARVVDYAVALLHVAWMLKSIAQ